MRKNKLEAWILLLLAFSSYSQGIVGKWNGILKVQGTQLRLVFNINKNENGYTSTMDCPDQGVKGVPVTTTSFENSILKIEVANAKIKYNGTLNSENNFIGVFNQSGQSFSMNLSKESIDGEKLIRSQEPTKPYSYYSEDITFENTIDKIFLAGTLTLPKKEGKFSAAILISGSGPQDRDEGLLGHKPFLVLSDYLTKNGIAVLRFDDRGTAKSGGDFKTATTENFTTDVEFAIKYLQKRKEINKNKIGVIGHSEGGIIAPMIASKSNEVSFIVLLAGTGISGDKLLLLQQELIGRANNVNEIELQKSLETNMKLFDIIVKSTSLETLKTDLTYYINQTSDANFEVNKPENMTKEEFVSF